jgi:large subunit ribosomal protein L23
MGLFGKKKEKEVEVKEAPKKEVKKTPALKKVSKKSAKPNNAFKKDISYVVKNPRITEKAAVLAELANAYTFDIHPEATKSDVAEVIEKTYKVVPIKIAIAKIPSKKVQVRGQRGKHGVKSGGKKAIVYLKKGDKIEFV